jgi:hypothetical protein
LLTQPDATIQPQSRWRRFRGRRLWVAVAAVVGITVALVTVTITGPRVSVRWQATVSPTERLALEQRHDLRNGRQDNADDPLVWRYELGNWSRDAVAALVHDPAAADTNYINRSTYAVDEPSLTVATRIPWILGRLPFPFSTDNRFESLWFFFRIQSLCMLVAGAVLLWCANLVDARRRQMIAVGAILAVAIAALTLAYRPSMLRMADSAMYTKNRTNFERALRAINFENHLTLAVIVTLYPTFGSGEDAPEKTFDAMTRIATVWFVVCALAIGIVERWSPQVVRYLALVMLAPLTLMYFGHRDFAYLSLNAATFPLLAHGIREGSKRLEAGSALAGLGAALHAFGLLALAGAWLACLTVRASFMQRIERILRIAAWGTAAWVGWIAIHIIVLKLQIATGHAASGSWRPLFVDEPGRRLNVALLSAAGVRDLVMSAWIVGAPLLVVATSLWTRHRDQVRVLVCYALPSILFLSFYWPPQGLGVDTGHVFGTFPAFFAAAWLCAQERRHTAIGAALLVSAHLAFWRVVLDTRFVNWTLPT